MENTIKHMMEGCRQAKQILSDPQFNEEQHKDLIEKMHAYIAYCGLEYQKHQESEYLSKIKILKEKYQSKFQNRLLFLSFLVVTLLALFMALTNDSLLHYHQPITWKLQQIFGFKHYNQDELSREDQTRLLNSALAQYNNGSFNKKLEEVSRATQQIKVHSRFDVIKDFISNIYSPVNDTTRAAAAGIHWHPIDKEYITDTLQHAVDYLKELDVSSEVKTLTDETIRTGKQLKEFGDFVNQTLQFINPKY